MVMLLMVVAEVSHRKASPKCINRAMKLVNFGDCFHKDMPIMDGAPSPSFEQPGLKKASVTQGIRCNSRSLDKSLIVVTIEFKCRFFLWTCYYCSRRYL